MRSLTKKTIYLLLITVLFAAGCRPTLIAKTSQTHHADSVVVVETIRDTIVIVPRDSSLIRCMLAIDSLGNIFIRGMLEYRIGENVKPPHVAIKDNVLTAKVEVDSLAIHLQMKDRFEKTITESKEVITNTVEVNRLSWWQKLWIGLGMGFTAITVICLVIKRFKPKL